MTEWIQWIIQVVAYGVICFLLKRELGQMDQRHKDLLEQIKAVEREAKADTQKVERSWTASSRSCRSSIR